MKILPAQALGFKWFAIDRVTKRVNPSNSAKSPLRGTFAMHFHSLFFWLEFANAEPQNSFVNLLMGFQIWSMKVSSKFGSFLEGVASPGFRV